MDTIRKLFAIDPGTQECGFSFYEDGKLADSGAIKSNYSDPYKRCEEIAKHLFYEISVNQPDLVICEKPLKKGPGARSGRIFILFHFVGMLHGILCQHSINFKLIEVMKWKGSLPKEIHHPRIIRDIKEKYDTNLEGESPDLIDAVGLGDWYLTNCV